MKKVALVTGASQGIGAAIAKQLANDGFAVGLVARHMDKIKKVAAEIEKNGGQALPIICDVSKREDVFDAVDKTANEFGDLTVMVNNAGVAPTTPIDEVTPEVLAQAEAINVGGVVWGIQAASKKFREFKHGGKIINASSQAGQKGNPNLTVYGSTKFAIKGITQTTAQELAKDNITVNAYCPGIVKTPMMEDIAKEVGKKAGKDAEWGMQQFAQNIALGRLSDPQDVANLVSFLASDKASYITGQSILVDGGMVFR